MRIRPMFLAAAAVLALAGCSDGGPPVVEQEDDGQGSADESGDEGASNAEGEVSDDAGSDGDDAASDGPDGEPDAPQAAMAYFEALVTGTPDEMAAMHEHAAEGSPADVYAELQIAGAAAQQQEGMPLPPMALEIIDDGVERCPETPGMGECFAFTNLTVSDGKLVTFDAGGERIDDRLAAGGEVATDGPVTVELTAAYHSVESDGLNIALELSNDGDAPVNTDLYSAEYVTSDNRQVSVQNGLGPTTLRPGVSARAILAFPDQGVGGTLYLTGSSEDYMTGYEWTLELPDGAG